MDWKDALAGLKASGTIPVGEEQIADEVENAAETLQKEPLRVEIDRRQRKGKTATVISGFLCDDDAIKDVAHSLKQKIGTGGSARGGEILLQGDWKDKAASMLREMGYKVKVIG
jgi:translation initiation factor 1